MDPATGTPVFSSHPSFPSHLILSHLIPSHLIPAWSVKTQGPASNTASDAGQALFCKGPYTRHMESCVLFVANRQRMASYVESYGRGHSSGMLFWGGVKEFADGSLGARTALMWEPYVDAGEPDYS